MLVFLLVLLMLLFFLTQAEHAAFEKICHLEGEWATPAAITMIYSQPLSRADRWWQDAVFY